MPKKSASSRPPAPEAAVPAHLAHLVTAMEGSVDTSDIPERSKPGTRVARDAEGRLPRYARGPICTAILGELTARGMTRYELWKKAHRYCETLSLSAVYEFLGGRRPINHIYVEALIRAAGLKLTAARKPSSKHKKSAESPSKPAAKARS